MIRFHHTLAAWLFIGAICLAEPLFRNGDGGRLGYRIPVAVQGDGSIICFVEHKYAAGYDYSGGIYARRSVDEGATWSSIYGVVSLTGAGNCSPVYDPATKVITLAYCLNPSLTTSQAYFTTSNDDGITWETPTEIPDAKPDGGGQFYFGPNPGLKVGNRLLFPFYYRPTPGNDAFVGAAWTDDGGATWDQSTTSLEPENIGAIEPALYRLPNGVLRMDCRHKDNGNSRRYTESTDDGETWSDVTTYATIKCGESQASTYCDGRHVALCVPGGDASRSRLTLYTSNDGTFDTAHRRTIHDGYAAYSQIIPRSDGSLLVIYEAGDDVHSAGGAASWAHDIRTAVVRNPWASLTNPNPHTDFLAALPGGAALLLPGTDDERAYFSDVQGSLSAKFRDGNYIGAVLNRGRTGGLLHVETENTHLRVEKHPTLGYGLRFHPDLSRANGALLLADTDVDFVHQSGKFSLLVRFELSAHGSGESHLIFDNCNQGAADNGFCLGVNGDRYLQLYVRDGGSSRINAQLSSLGVLTIGTPYDLLVSCEGVGSPAQAWLRSVGGSTVTHSTANLAGSVSANEASDSLLIGNRQPGIYRPFDGWLFRAVIGKEAWGATELEVLSE